MPLAGKALKLPTDSLLVTGKRGIDLLHSLWKEDFPDQCNLGWNYCTFVAIICLDCMSIAMAMAAVTLLMQRANLELQQTLPLFPPAF